MLWILSRSHFNNDSNEKNRETSSLFMKDRDLFEPLTRERIEHDLSSENCEKIKLSPNLATHTVIKISPLRCVAVTFKRFLFIKS